MLATCPGYDLDGVLTPSIGADRARPGRGLPELDAERRRRRVRRASTGCCASRSPPRRWPRAPQPVAQPGGARRTSSTRPSTHGAHAAGEHRLALVGHADRAGSAGAWQLKVFVSGQTRSQLFVDGLATAQRRVNIGAYPAAPGSSLRRAARRPRSRTTRRAEALQQAHLLGHADRRARSSTSTCALVLGRDAGGRVQLRWVPPDDQAASIAAAVVGRARRPARP